MNSKNIGIIILAAGGSTRFGSPKQLARLEGKSLIRSITEVAVSTGLKTLVVLGSQAEQIKSEISELEVSVLINNDWETGLSSSIKAGLLRMLELNPDASAIMLVLSDQPSISKHTLENLAASQIETGKPIVASSYSNIAGTPALFTKPLFPQLMKLEGDRGAKTLIEKHRDADVALVDAPEAEFDIDFQDDLERIN